MATGTKEIHFEGHIEKHLIEHEGYISISPDKYDKDLCLIPEEVIAFIKVTQPKAYEALQKEYGATADAQIVRNVARFLDKDNEKTLKLLRKGYKDRGQHIKLAFQKPVNDKSPEHGLWYSKNRLAIVRQFKYSIRNNNEIDIVIFVNGIPVITAELKNALTGQRHWNAIKQYIQDRDPKGEKFLEFKRCLVHFAVGTEEVYMCTQLKGKSTFFLPFNKGLKNENPNGFAVSYLWEDVWSRDSILELIFNFISIQTDTEKEYDKATNKLIEKTSTKLLFPRFHQRRAVQTLIEAIRTDGTGKNYLIQHSAGSGKSNTITWLAYRLSNFFQHFTDERALYDSIIVVTDRRVLNKQIQENIRQIDDRPGVVAYIDENSTSQDLKEAIEHRKRIIVTTLQKFPVISDTVSRFPDRKYAIIIDEAHSSQSGEAAGKMRAALSLDDEEELEELDDIIADKIRRKGQQPNISQFAFTATPKDKTIELFGTVINGEKTAFDKYSMEEAIEEKFILDVLKNYMSFKRYYTLITRSAIEDKEYEKKKTVRVLSNYADLHDNTIEMKSRIMIEHFIDHTVNEIQGRARAMLVTRSRLHALRYKLKFDAIMAEMKLPYRALVAFSGTVKDPDSGEEYTETSMNMLKGKISIPEALKLPENRILIVANKYQTGFDEPLMQTMFVDKKLGGTSTVQTLSRLNRTTRGKDRTMVLDFVNDPEQVQADFQKYYGKNYIAIENTTDPNILYDLENKIEAYGVMYSTEIEKFAEIFFMTSEQFELLQPILNTVSDRVADTLNDEELTEFKADIRSFTKLYRFLSQIVTFTDVELEKKYIFLSALVKKLPYVHSNLPLDVVNDIELDSYRIQHKFTTDLELNSQDGEMEGLKPGGGGKDADEYDFLTNIIKTMNDTFGLKLNEEDAEELGKIQDKVEKDNELLSYFNASNSKENIRTKFEEHVDRALMDSVNTRLDFFNTMTEDRANKMFKNMFFEFMFKSMMNEHRAK